MKLATRAAVADTTEHRGIERLTDDQERELGRRNQRILYYQLPHARPAGQMRCSEHRSCGVARVW